MRAARAIAIWALALLVPLGALIAAMQSPLLAWRDPVYIAAGIAGVIAMALLLYQPLLAGGYLPGLSDRSRRRLHRLVGLTLIAAVIVHLVGLWATSPPDVIDALLFRSPTSFSAWGVIAMWCLFAAAGIVALRRRLRLGWRLLRLLHASLAGLTILASCAHALLVEGTMEISTKIALCLLVLLAFLWLLLDLRLWRLRRKS